MKKQKSPKSELKEIYSECFSFIKESRNYIYFATFLFLAFALVGFFITPSPEIELKLIETLQGISSKFEGLNLFQATWEIFANNLTASFFVILGGFVLGITSFIMISFNGYILGYVAEKVVAQEGLLILWRLLPHGIFELPAVLISVGLGLRIGTSLFSGKGKTLQLFNKSMKVFIWVVWVLLFVAAIIEGLLVFFIN